MSRLTRDETAELSRETKFSGANGDRETLFFLVQLTASWQPYPVDPYSVICDDHTYIVPCVSIVTWMGHPRSLHLTPRPTSLHFDTLLVQEQCPRPSTRSEEIYDGVSFGFATNTHCF